MSESVRYVFDTNTLVSALLLEHSKPGQAFRLALRYGCVYLEPTEGVRACRDARDDKFLELAVSGCASCIITGDADLLALHPFRGMTIVTPAQFLQAGEEKVADEKA